METIRLLVIEDDLVDQKVVQRSLAKSFLELEVDFVQTLSEIDDFISEGKNWDVILSDYFLPGFTGLEVIKILKLEKGILAPILVMTGMNDASIAQKVLDAGAFDFLSKSMITPEGIGWALRNTLRVNKQQQQTNLALQALQEREEQLHEIQRIAGLGSWELDLPGHEMLWTDEVYRILGFKEEEAPLSFPDFIELIHEADQGLFKETLDLVSKNGVPLDIQYRIRKPETEDYIDISGRIAPNWVNGTIERLYGTMLDVSLQKQTERDLIEAKLHAENSARLKQEFLANMSHEIRTPMNAILGFTDVVLDHGASEFITEKVSKIKSAGNSLLVIINDILDLSKIEAGQLEITQNKFELYEFLSRITGSLKPLAEKKKLRLILDCEEHLPQYLIGDDVRVGQILTNLIGNAIKFTNVGFVELRVRKLSQANQKLRLRFEIEDSGIGISEEKQSKMFDAFTQADSNTSRTYGGTGLGLAISKKLVELQGGKIGLESDGVQGSVFYFELEFDINQASPDFVKKTEDNQSLQGVKLLLVEDNEMNQELAAHFLRRWGVDFDIANNGKEGVDKVLNGDYQIVLMDISMPVMDGFQATEIIRTSNQPQSSIPIVAMTANAFSGDIQRYLEAGMNDYITKPFDHRELQAMIGRVVSGGNREGYLVTKDEQKVAENEASSIIDLSNLKTMAEGNEDFVREMVGVFLKEAPKTVSRIRAGVMRRDLEEIRSAAHKLRSPAKLMGMREVPELAEFIEHNVINKEKFEEVNLAISKLMTQMEIAFDQASKTIH